MTGQYGSVQMTDLTSTIVCLQLFMPGTGAAAKCEELV